MVRFKTFLEEAEKRKSARRRKPYASLNPDKDFTYRFRLTDDGRGLVQCDEDGNDISGGIRIDSGRGALSNTFLNGDRAVKMAVLLTKYRQFKKRYPEKEKNFDWYCRNVFGFEDGKKLTARKFDTDREFELGNGEKAVFVQDKYWSYRLKDDPLNRNVNKNTVGKLVKDAKSIYDVLTRISLISKSYLDKNGELVSFTYLGDGYYVLDGLETDRKVFRDVVYRWIGERTTRGEIVG